MQQSRDSITYYTIDASDKDKRLVVLLNNCSAEGLLDWKKIDGYNDCLWCPCKAECDRAWEECGLCSYAEGKAKLKAVFRLKHQ